MTLSEKLKVLMKSVVLTVYYFFMALFSKKKLAYDNDEIIVSLTSYGKRINFVFLTIESIIQQSYMPRKIYLWLYIDDIPKGLSGWILNRQKMRGLSINYVERDSRSYKKLSPLFEMEEIDFDYVVTADDDVFYPKNWLEIFKDNYTKQSDCVYCYRGRIITYKSDNIDPVRYSDWPLANIKNSLANNLIPTGVSGVCYPRGAISDDVFDYLTIDKICPCADDIWYKMITVKNRYVSKLVVEHSTHFTPVLTGFGKGLEKVNVHNDYNTVQFTASMKYFKISVSDLVGE